MAKLLAERNRLRNFRFVVLGIILLTVMIRLPALLHRQAIYDEETYSVVANAITARTAEGMICRMNDSHSE